MGRVQFLIKLCYYFINSYYFLLVTVSHFYLYISIFGETLKNISATDFATESKPDTLGVGFRSLYILKFSWWFKCAADFDNSYSEPFVHSITQQVCIDYQLCPGTILNTGDLEKKKKLEDCHQRSQLLFGQSAGPWSYRSLKNFGFYSRCKGRPWMGWERRRLSTEVTWSDLDF